MNYDVFQNKIFRVFYKEKEMKIQRSRGVIENIVRKHIINSIIISERKNGVGQFKIKNLPEPMKNLNLKIQVTKIIQIQTNNEFSS